MSARQILSAPVSFNSSGNNVLVASVSGSSISIVKLAIVVAAATNLTVLDGASSLSGAMAMSANGSIVLDYDPFGWFWGSVGNAIKINSSNAVQVSGTVWYQVFP